MADDKEAKPKTVSVGEGKCPYCKKAVLVSKTKKLITEGIPAEYDEKVKIEKDIQTKLEK